MNKKDTNKIKSNPEKHIKWMCYDILISIDSQVFDLSIKPLTERLIGGSYCYFCVGKYRTKTWINKHSVNVLGFISD
jgi:hypothetical protein